MCKQYNRNNEVLSYGGIGGYPRSYTSTSIGRECCKKRNCSVDGVPKSKCKKMVPQRVMQDCEYFLDLPRGRAYEETIDLWGKPENT